jgi:opacity protein-like surface antigen
LNTTASSVPGGVTRLFSDGNTVAVGASGNLDLTDYGTARGRAGYVVGNLLPYGFIGMAVGRASYSVNTATLVQQPSNNGTETFFLFLIAPDKITLYFGAIRSAPDLIGR